MNKLLIISLLLFFTITSAVAQQKEYYDIRRIIPNMFVEGIWELASCYTKSDSGLVDLTNVDTCEIHSFEIREKLLHVISRERNKFGEVTENKRYGIYQQKGTDVLIINKLIQRKTLKKGK